MKRFCVMTTGRSGSTALMDAIAANEDVAVPATHLSCPDHELFHPRRVRGFAETLARRTGRPIRGELELVDAFYACCEDRLYAGFKSMPDRHRALAELCARPEVRMITLVRRDVLSTAASFLLAMTRDTWRREGGVPEERLTFERAHERQLAGNLAYLHRSVRMLDAIPDAIRLVYEDLCDPAYVCAELDAFFDRPVRLRAPKSPTDARSYVTNHDAFERFVTDAWARLENGS